MNKAMVNKKIPVKKVEVTENKMVNYLFIAAVSILLIMAPFFRGLYFRQNYIPFTISIISIFISFILYGSFVKHRLFTINLMDISLLLLPIGFALSSLVSVNMKSAFDAIIKYIAYFMLYFIVSRLSDGKIGTKLLLTTVLFSLFLVSVTGMLTISGYLDLKGVTEYNRLYGLYQYPNTTGSMLGAGILICIGMLRGSGDRLLNILLQVLLISLLSGFIMTLSLGAFLVFAVVALIYFIIADWKYKLNQIIAYVVTLLSSIPVLISYFSGNMNKTFLGAYIASISLGIAFQFIYNYMNRKYISALSEKKNRIIVIAIVALTILAVIMAISIPGIVPQSIVEKIWNEELKVGNASDRLVYTKDAVSMFMDNLPLGAGGGAWQDLYYKYQSFPYNSTEAHNFYIQLAIETGIIGIAAIVGVLFLLTKRFYEDLKMGKDGIQISVYFGIYMILGHAVLDFDLSLAAPMFLLMMLIGLVYGQGTSEDKKVVKSKYTAYGFILIAVAALFFSTMIYMGISNGNKAAAQIESNLDGAVALYEKAMTQDKYNAASRADYAQLMYNKLAATKDREYLDKLNKALEDIEKYEPYNWKYKSTIISLLLSTGKIEQGVEMADNMVRMKPLDVNSYIIKAQVNLQIADYFYKNKKQDEAIKYLDRTIATQQEWQTASAKSIKPIKTSEQLKELVEQAQSLKGSIGQK